MVFIHRWSLFTGLTVIAHLCLTPFMAFSSLTLMYSWLILVYYAIRTVLRFTSQCSLSQFFSVSLFSTIFCMCMCVCVCVCACSPPAFELSCCLLRLSLFGHDRSYTPVCELLTLDIMRSNRHNVQNHWE